MVFTFDYITVVFGRQSANDDSRPDSRHVVSGENCFMLNNNTTYRGETLTKLTS